MGSFSSFKGVYWDVVGENVTQSDLSKDQHSTATDAGGFVSVFSAQHWFVNMDSFVPFNLCVKPSLISTC